MNASGPRDRAAGFRILQQGHRRACWLVILLLVPIPSWAKTHALLVGVSHYPYLDYRWQLEGPTNDVELFAEVLTEVFGVQSQNMVRLAGWPNDVTSRPTRNNIRRQFARLAADVEPGDQVVILLGGHGSRQPANDETNDLEPDGLDEIFLPADVKGWNGSAGRVEGAIVDDELRTWLSAIRERGAFVWCLIDACHSGTMVRGGGEIDRQLPAAALGIPSTAQPKVEPQRDGTTLDPIRERHNLGLDDAADGLVAMYASQPYESAPERILPWPDGRPHGLFTYTVAAALRQHAGPLTYRELAAAVTVRYRAMGRAQPTPLFEGGGLDREVLGLSAWPQRPRWLLGPEIATRPGHYPLAVGALLGLAVGTKLTVFPPTGHNHSESALGQVEVVDVDALKAIVRQQRFSEAGSNGPPALPIGSRCTPLDLDFGDFELRIGLQADDGTLWPAGAGPADLEAALSLASTAPNNLTRRVDQTADAEWFVRVRGDELVLVPASGWSDSAVPGEPIAEAFRIGQRSHRKDLSQRLSTVLQTIARAHHLTSLETSRQVNSAALSIALEIYRFRDTDDRTGELVAWGPHGLVLHPGEWIAFSATNRSPHTVDLTLLFIDSSYGIRPLFPRSNHSNRLQPGERAFPIYRTRLNDATLGGESVVAIAVKAAGPIQSFVALAQPSLARYRAQQQTRGQRAGSPLTELLERALYGAAHRRNVGAMPAEDYAIAVLPWITRRPAPTAAPPASIPR